MRDSSYKHAKKRKNDVVKSFKKIRIGKNVYGLSRSESLKNFHKFTKHSYSCKCRLCSQLREENKKNKRILEDKRHPIENMDEWSDNYCIE